MYNHDSTIFIGSGNVARSISLYVVTYLSWFDGVGLDPWNVFSRSRV